MRSKEKILQQVYAKLQARTTAQLCADVEGTNNNDDKNIPLVREWIMNVLEARDPEAFDKWIDADDPDIMNYPSVFFN